MTKARAFSIYAILASLIGLGGVVLTAIYIQDIPSTRPYINMSEAVAMLGMVATGVLFAVSLGLWWIAPRTNRRRDLRIWQILTAGIILGNTLPFFHAKTEYWLARSWRGASRTYVEALQAALSGTDPLSYAATCWPVVAFMLIWIMRTRTD